ncbi:hypothetical protein M430DRAFT_19666 [Amorphotheca resinae ATCC 22711]|uniref:Uncharacterized protein n=1 Tax=Amorphotheca resinae ATCC 22711 TaxID=857342 RepID=A0A2T3AZX8_AMORE|nr:hypothetical protein M430DRAFT_19666 [Amorphotheca resinae ATCC 22711]PSS16692.1 hypothetical protein M430DRAFT_19666 [Amorphotheca resinae ATCC 22711]
MSTLHSTIDALAALCTSVPEWNARLDELNGQIALRQVELARLTDDHAPARSLKHQGSTESLRPKDGAENPSAGDDDAKGLESSPLPAQKSKGAPPRPSSLTAGRSAAVVTPPPPRHHESPGPSTGAQARQHAHGHGHGHGHAASPAHQPRTGLGKLRKRKTESVASGESLAPKYRTRSMIIVYYDSAVQTAFEELVKFVSGSRNAMRKGRMAAKMAEMRRAAELEVEADGDDDDEDEEGVQLIGLSAKNRSLSAAQGKEGASSSKADPALPRPRSSRHGSGLSGDAKPDNLGSVLSAGILKGYMRGGEGAATAIFDEIDKGLEWCQSQCEHAAHQFLRDGDCSTEIENIKRKLLEVKAMAEKEKEKLQKEEASTPAGRAAALLEESGGGAAKPPPVRVRRDITAPRDHHLVVDDDLAADHMAIDDMDVDDMAVDEVIEDLNPSKLVFKRSRDIGH